MIEKFDDVDKMEKSYENLEKEFTKKCQELSMVKKQLEELEASHVESKLQETQETVEDVVSKPDENSLGLEFRERANDFLRLNADAKNYSKEISKILLSDKEILKLADPFKVAYALAKINAPKEEKKEEVVQILPEEKKVAETIVPMLSNSVVGSTPAKPKPKFRSLEDAREELISRYFS